jgi:hypothetical protein
VSAIIDPVGRVVKHTDTFTQEALAADIAWLHARTLYEILGDIPWWLLTLVAAGLAFSPNRRPSASHPSPSPSPSPGPTPTPAEAPTDSGTPSTRSTRRSRPQGHPAGSASTESDATFRFKARTWFARQGGDSSRDGE